MLLPLPEPLSSQLSHLFAGRYVNSLLNAHSHQQSVGLLVELEKRQLKRVSFIFAHEYVPAVHAVHEYLLLPMSPVALDVSANKFPLM